MNTNNIDVLYTDPAGSRMRISLNQLSDGYKGTLSLVADIAYRMANLNPQLLDRVLEETGGIILIDEADLHLHQASLLVAPLQVFVLRTARNPLRI